MKKLSEILNNNNNNNHRVGLSIDDEPNSQCKVNQNNRKSLKIIRLFEHEKVELDYLV